MQIEPISNQRVCTVYVFMCMNAFRVYWMDNNNVNRLVYCTVAAQIHTHTHTLHQVTAYYLISSIAITNWLTGCLLCFSPSCCSCCFSAIYSIHFLSGISYSARAWVSSACTFIYCLCVNFFTQLCAVPQFVHTYYRNVWICM